MSQQGGEIHDSFHKLKEEKQARQCNIYYIKLKSNTIFVQCINSAKIIKVFDTYNTRFSNYGFYLKIV